MDSYIKYVEECRKKRLPNIIRNSSLLHAEELIKSLIGFATDKKLPIRIVSGSLYEGFWSPVKSLLEKYLKEAKNAQSLEIIIIDAYKQKTLESNPVYQLLQDYSRIPEDEPACKIYKGINKRLVVNQPHYLLVGNEAYRKERRQNRAIATASFNDPSNGKELLNNFQFICEYIKFTSDLKLQTN